MSQIPSLFADSSVTWANRALIAAAVVYLYDSVITFASEIELYRYSKQRVLHLIFISTRYLSLLYQLFVICGIAWSRFTPQRFRCCHAVYNLTSTLLCSCRILDNVMLTIDTMFQVSYIAAIARRAHFVPFRSQWIKTVPFTLFGLLPVFVNIIAPNPSFFPDCRALKPSPTSEIVALLPCLRAAFDALAAVALVVELRRHMGLVMVGTKRIIQELVYEEIKDICTIFSIMAIEAVFAQMPSVRNHARNFIAPFFDALTALMTARFIMGVVERRKPEDQTDKTSVFVSPRGSLTLHRNHSSNPLPPLEAHTSQAPIWPPETMDFNDIRTCLDCASTTVDWPALPTPFHEGERRVAQNAGRQDLSCFDYSDVREDTSYK